MNQLNRAKRAQLIGALVEGNSLRATARMTDVAFNTVLKLVPEVGRVCAEYQARTLRNLKCRRIQCDESWQFCYSKARNVPDHLRDVPGYGDVWTWIAICADTKLVPCWLVGGRDAGYAYVFISDLASRLAKRVQLTTDGHKAYLNAVEDSFGADIDYAMLVKLYGRSPETETRYSPAECIGCRVVQITGEPEPTYISTSYAERLNLTMRMNMRRFTRLTNGFSKKIENHEAAVTLHFMHYNFARIHQTLRVTPAMEAGVAGHVWSLEEIAALLD